MEQECLRILLRSPHPVIWCLARGMYRRLPTTPVDCRPAVDDGRLVIVSPFLEQIRHVTAETAMTRNRLSITDDRYVPRTTEACGSSNTTASRFRLKDKRGTECDASVTDLPKNTWRNISASLTLSHLGIPTMLSTGSGDVVHLRSEATLEC